ncbi:pyridoxal-phosphate dependent enzyme [soil metagenome]
MPFSYRITPVEQLDDPLFIEFGVQVLIKREDLNHSEISGNKWWKLRYNIKEALRLNYDTLLTFGGAYSNHIFATAAAAYEAGIKSIGIIRGEETHPLNSTLLFAKKRDMLLHYVSREEYRQKTEEGFISNLKKQFGEFYLIPEGGSNKLAVEGCSEFAKKHLSVIECDYVCLPVGTGGTLAGIVAGLEGKKQVIAYSSLKGGAFLEENVRNLLPMEAVHLKNWEINTAYHFGGYGKRTTELMDFISIQKRNNNLVLDAVYTAKMLFGVYDGIRKGKFDRGSIILVIHTGGLQGDYSAETTN